MTNDKKKKVARKDAAHYVDNDLLYKELTIYIKDHAECTKKGLPLPRVPEYIGECILAISNKLSNSPNFMNYPFKEDMIADGVENALQYLRNFDYEKYSNPFAYFTQIIWYAFVRRIGKEKKQLYVKLKSIQNTLMEYDSDVIQISKYGSEYSDSNMHDFIDTFEKTNNLDEEFKNKKKRKKRKIRTNKLSMLLNLFALD